MLSLGFFSAQNFDLVAVGTVVAAILVMGIAIYFTNQKSITAFSFLLVAVTNSIYAILNLLSYRVALDDEVTVILLRSALFFAVLASLFLLRLFYVFPKEEARLPKWYRYGANPLAALVALLTLTPLVFESVHRSSGGILTAANGPLIPLFGLTIMILVVGALVVLGRSWWKAGGVERTQLTYIVIGTSVTFVAILFFNVILTLVFKATQYTVLAPVYFFPFLAFTAYAIARHKLFDVKILTVGVLAFVLSVTVLLQAIFSETLEEILFGVSQFALVVIFSIWLLQATWREIEQREEIQKLADQLSSANERLRVLDRQKSEFLSIAAHQLRTPLTAIKGYTSLMIEGSYGKLPEEAQRIVENIFASSRRMVDTVSDFLNVSRIEQGALEYRKTYLDICEMTRRVTEELMLNAQEKGLKLSYEQHIEGECHVFVDESKVEHVISNLIDNAIKYTPKGSILVSSEQLGEKFRIAVKDTGAGIPKEALPTLFDKFIRARNAKDINVTGSGLGLYVAREMIRAHGGSVWAESDGEGRGSTFFVEIPVAKGNERREEV